MNTETSTCNHNYVLKLTKTEYWPGQFVNGMPFYLCSKCGKRGAEYTGSCLF